MYENYTGKDLIIATGAPGSRWSGILRMLTANIDINVSDENEDRLYDHMAINPKTGKLAARGWHRGAYWGPDHDFGSQFDVINQLSKDEIVEQFKGPYANWEPGIKIIKSHWFAYHLPFLKKMFPEAKFVGVYRTNEECFEWWHICGGWDISYPHYYWYKNDERMKQKIAEENEHIMNFFSNLEFRKIDEMFSLLGLPNKTITFEDFTARDSKLTDVLANRRGDREEGNYEDALNFVVERHKIGII